ncbi:MAG: c-type cytochrome [Bacteroidota bacterium]
MIYSLIFVAAQAWAQDAPEAVVQYCARCHGTDGIATQPGMPHLNGQQDTYLIDVSTRFQRGKLITTVTDHVPKALDADQIDLIARHYAGSKAVRPRQETDPQKVAQGETVYRNRCADCHIDNGRDADKDAPFVGAQNLDYLLNQTRLFVTGKRRFGYLQDEAFKGLSDDELVDDAALRVQAGLGRSQRGEMKINGGVAHGLRPFGGP